MPLNFLRVSPPTRQTTRRAKASSASKNPFSAFRDARDATPCKYHARFAPRCSSL